MLRRIRILPLTLLTCVSTVCLRAAEGSDATPLRLLTSAGEIRQLSLAEAARKHPIRIRAVVTVSTTPHGAGYFAQEATGPIYVFAMPSADGLEAGQIVDLEGVSDAGAYAPCVRELQRTVLERAMLPEPRRLSYEQIASGREDCQFAEIEGIVRSASGSFCILAMGDGRVEVEIAALEPGGLHHLVDARVRLRGAVGGLFNLKRQWVGVRFKVSSLAQVMVERPAPADPFAASAHPIGDLLQWELNQAGRHRVKVRGVVTHFQPGVSLFIRENSTGLQIRTSETQAVDPGDGVEVLGFPVLGAYSAALEDAVFRRVGHVSAPAPRPAAPAELLQGEWDASLVAVRGILLESVRQQGARVLVMQAGDIIFHAQLGLAARDARELPLAGSLLELTGICVVAETFVTGSKLRPRVFSLLLRSPADIRVVRYPSWWTAQRLWQALGLISLAVFGILSWVWLLRRQVREKTAALKEQAQREAVLEERTRIAQELHDTLDQELTGISLQLNAALSQVKDDPIGRRLNVIHRLLQRSQSEVRRSVWDLRRPALEPGGLAAALNDTAVQLRNGSTATLDVSVSGVARPLSALVEHHLLRIAAEAVTNAYKHACASRIRIEINHEMGTVQLCIEDDGRGFVADQAPGYAAGHFGLIGMHERARKIGGTLTLHSEPGKGTRIIVCVQQVFAPQKSKVLNGS